MELQILSILGQLEIQLLLACLPPEGEGRIKKQNKKKSQILCTQMHSQLKYKHSISIATLY